MRSPPSPARSWSRKTSVVVIAPSRLVSIILEAAGAARRAPRQNADPAQDSYALGVSEEPSSAMGRARRLGRVPIHRTSLGRETS